MSSAFGLLVRFTLREDAAEAVDQLAARPSSRSGRTSPAATQAVSASSRRVKVAAAW
jgi:hypothetical protein